MRLVLRIIAYAVFTLLIVFSFILANRAMEANVEADKFMGIYE